MIQFVVGKKREGRSAWRVFWLGGDLAESTQTWQPVRPDTWRLRGMLWGFTSSWTLWLSAGEDENDLFAGLRNAARTSGVPVSVLERGTVVSWPNATLAVLHSGGRPRKADRINNQSVVAVFERDGHRVLLTGDAGAPTERGLVASGLLPRADLLKVGHHGSRTSTTPELLAAVRPRMALISCGRENRFGHPAAATLQTLAAFGVRTFRTDRLSDVRVELLPEATRLTWRGLE